MNGATVALTLAHDPPATPTKAPAPTEVEQQIGAAVADAAAAIGQALADSEAGGSMTPATKMLGGSRLARVAELQLAHFGEFDFAAVARVEGKRELHRRHDAIFRQHYGAGLDMAKIDMALGEILDWVIGIADRVVADERAISH
jgi:hypothetical protein